MGIGRKLSDFWASLGSGSKAASTAEETPMSNRPTTGQRGGKLVTRVFVASDDPNISYSIREQLLLLGIECLPSRVTTLDQAAHVVAAETANKADSRSADAGQGDNTIFSDLVFVVLPPEIEKSLATVRDISLRGQPTHLFAVGPTDDGRLVLRSLREGATEFLDMADLATELAAAIERLKRSNSGAVRGHKVCLMSPNGGTGCSTIAANLATVLAEQHGGCVLLDLDPLYGDLASLLDLKPVHTSADLCRSVARLDRSLVERSLTAHDNGIRLMAAPSKLSDAVNVNWEGVRKVMTLAIDMAPFIIADLSNGFLGPLSEAAEHADQILLVLRLDFTSLRNTRRILEYMESRDIPKSRLRIIANGQGRSGELNASDAESALGVSIDHFISDDAKNINRANNQGIPVVSYAPSAKVSKQLIALAQQLGPQPAK